jgi:hypothetical protein
VILLDVEARQEVDREMVEVEQGEREFRQIGHLGQRSKSVAIFRELEATRRLDCAPQCRMTTARKYRPFVLPALPNLPDHLE